MLQNYETLERLFIESITKLAALIDDILMFGVGLTLLELMSP